MASDTATLDLERVHEERQRLEAERAGGSAARGPLGPDDQAPADELHVDTDPATRAAQIVQEVLAAAEQRRGGADSAPMTEPADGTAAARARRIVEEVLATATEASDAQHVTSGDDGEDEEFVPSIVRADLVLLTASEPLVLLPGRAYDPEDGAYVPDALASPLPSLVDRALSSLAVHARHGTDADELTTPTTVREAIRGAGESSNRHGVRWIVAGAVWALAFALAGPLAYKTIISSADMTIELWEGDNTVAEQQVEVPEDELPEPSTPGEQQPAEAELEG
ncbi:MAG: hypothetical protein KY457_09950 [Actinobacteria bacterium]|nr:hypothetical protein [Actinomycetota bacterium]